MNFSILSPCLSCLKCGDPLMSFSVISDGQEMVPAYWDIVISADGQRGHCTGMIPELFRDELYFEFHSDHLRCRRQFTNLSHNVLKLNELKVEIKGITFGGIRRDDFFYHNENPRIYEVMSFPIDYKRAQDSSALNSDYDIQAGTCWADPGVICERIGRSPYQPFPALLVGNYKCLNGIVFGTLSQRQCYHNFLLSHDKNNEILFQIFSSFKGVDYRKVVPGETITDWWYLGRTDDVTNINTIFCGYTKVLRDVLPPLYGKTKINRDNLVWGSWNDGIFRNISEDMLLQEAKFLKNNFPTVRWMQLDDGYSAYQKDIAHGLGVPYDGPDGIDKEKFPMGLRHYTNQLREIGLRPALWIGNDCPVSSGIFREHPDWFIDYSYRTEEAEPLDVSQDEVRRYMCSALDTLVTEYGFEGVKQDFWSFAFEDSTSLLKNKDKSGYEWRSWWLTEMRKRLPDDGYFQSGCDIAMGNPFLGEYYTNYRYGIDIASGNWDHVKTNYLWGMACFATHTSDLFVPNSDAIGLFPGLNDTEAQFCSTYCLVTRTAVEIAGRLSLCDKSNPRYKMLKKCVCNPNNGQDVFIAHWNYLDRTEKYPPVLYFKTPHFSSSEDSPGLPCRTVGMFNLADEEKEIVFTMISIGLKPDVEYILTNVWTGVVLEIKEQYHTKISPHGCMLWSVSERPAGDYPILLDADVRIVKSEIRDGILHLENDYAGQATLQFNRALKRMTINNQIADVGKSAVVSVALPAHAVILVR